MSYPTRSDTSQTIPPDPRRAEDRYGAIWRPHTSWRDRFRGLLSRVLGRPQRPLGARLAFSTVDKERYK